MFRATLLSIVLIFAAGPSVSLFCKVWCDPHAAAQAGCHNDDHAGKTSVQASRDCQDQALNGLAAVKEKVRRGAMPDSHGHAVPLPRYQVGTLEVATFGADVRGLAPPTHDRPLSTPLRI